MKLPESRVLVPPMLLAGAVLAACLGALLAHLPQVAQVLAPTAVALVVARVLFRRADAAGRADVGAAADRASAAEAQVAASARQASQLRHDLRGILSPAMLTADRLAANQDPIARRAGEAMISTVERAEERLRREQSPGPPSRPSSGPPPGRD